MQLKLYNSMGEAEAAYNLVLSNRSNITIESRMELRKANNEGVFPARLVFCVGVPRDWDRLLTELGDWNFEKGRTIFKHSKDLLETSKSCSA